MSSILLTMADLETAVPLNAALESAGFTTTMVSPLDDAPGALRREHPDLLILTGAVHEPSAGQLARLGREHQVETLRPPRARPPGSPGSTRCIRSACSSPPTPSAPSGRPGSAPPSCSPSRSGPRRP